VWATCAVSRPSPWRLLTKRLKTNILSGRKKKTGKVQYFAAAASASSKKEESSGDEDKD
jgi:hypothetical protein